MMFDNVTVLPIDQQVDWCALAAEQENTTLIVSCSKSRPENDLLRLFCEDIAQMDETLIAQAYASPQKILLAFVVEPQDAPAYESAAKAATKTIKKNNPHFSWAIVILVLPMGNQGLLYTRWHSIHLATKVAARTTIITDDDLCGLATKKHPTGHKAIAIPKGRRLAALLLFHDLLFCDHRRIKTTGLFNAGAKLGLVLAQGVANLFSTEFRLAAAQGTFRSRCVFYSQAPWELFLLYICQCYYLNTSIFRELKISPKNIANTFFPPTSPTFGEDINATVLLLKKLQLLTPHMNFFYIKTPAVGGNKKNGGLTAEYQRHKHFTRMQLTLSKIDRNFVAALPLNALRCKPNLIAFKAAAVKQWQSVGFDPGGVLGQVNKTLQRANTKLALTMLTERLLD
ncbi:MAG: hypothetical protein QXZ51_05035 [Candidatus Bathyarchaeia archaeon]